MSLLAPVLIAEPDAAAVSVRVVGGDGGLEGHVGAWASANGFTGKAGEVLLVPGHDGALAEVLFGAGARFEPASARGLAARLPGGLYRFEALPEPDATATALAFVLGGDRFDRYKSRDGQAARLVAPTGLARLPSR